MKKFVVDKKVFEALPGYCLGVLVAKGIENDRKNEKIESMLKKEIEKFLVEYKDTNVREVPGIKVYRDAFSSLGMNPNKFMCSIEALTKRVQKTGELPSINPVVDIGNAFSLKYLLPMGAHNIHNFEKDMEIRFSTEEDTFLGMGEKEPETMPYGELVYVSGNTVKTRRWIWRQSEDGKITDKTGYIFFPIDGFEDVNRENLLKARDELAEFLKNEMYCEVRTGYVDKENNEFIIEEDV